MRLGGAWSVWVGLLTACGGATHDQGEPSDAAAGFGGGGASQLTGGAGQLTAGVSSGDAAGAGANADPSGTTGGRDAETGGTTTGTGGDDCRTVGDEVGFCQIIRGCEKATLNVYCSEAGLDTWECNCVVNGVTLSYAITGQSGLDNCDAAESICAQAPPVEFSEPPICAPVTRSASDVTCDEQIECQGKVQLASGIDAVRRETMNVFCKGGTVEPDFLYYCSCSRGELRSFQVRDFDSAKGCGPITSLCQNGVNPTEVRCEPDAAQVTERGCTRSELCSRPVSVDGAEFEVVVRDELSCGVAQGGGARCTCQGARLDFEFVADAPDAGACDRASRVCHPPEPIELEGEPACAVAMESASEAQCTATLDCTASARVGEDALRLHGQLWIDCRLDAPSSSATCTCLGADESAVEFDAEDAWDLCGRAAEVCPERVAPEFGLVRPG